MSEAESWPGKRPLCMGVSIWQAWGPDSCGSLQPLPQNGWHGGPSDSLPGPAEPSPTSADAFHWSSSGNFSASESASLWLWGEHPPEVKQPPKPDTRHTSVTPSKALAWTAALRGQTEGGGPWP